MHTQASNLWDHSNPVALSNGNIVTIWMETGSGDYGDLKGQIYSPAGVKVGAAFPIATSTGDRQGEPYIAALGTGFVVVWRDQSGGGNSAKGQIFDSAGGKVGAEFRPGAYTGGAESSATVATLSNGNFIVAWDSGDIRFQLFTAAGTKVGGETVANSNTNDEQSRPHIAPLSDGGFVIVWHDKSATLGDTSGFSVKAQVFDASGVKSGSEILVNTSTAQHQWFTTVAGLTGGGFVVTWEDQSGAAGDSNTAVRAQMFTSAGARSGTEFLVNTNTTNGQTSPHISALTTGGFLIVWQDGSQTLGDTGTLAIKGQLFSATGVKQGSEFLVNTASSATKWFPYGGALANGGFAVMWKAFGTPGGPDVEYTRLRIFTPG